MLGLNEFEKKMAKAKSLNEAIEKLGLHLLEIAEPKKS